MQEADGVNVVGVENTNEFTPALIRVLFTARVAGPSSLFVAYS